jgi:nucleoside-diphosphate-sugar epimerase
MKTGDSANPKGVTALVTGGTGFIGSHLVRLLLKRGVPRIVATSASGRAGNFDALRDRVEVVRLDVGDFTDVLRLVEKDRPATIYHIGAMLAPACDGSPEAGIRANALGTYHVLEAARLFGVRRVVFASSMSVFSATHATTPEIDDFSVTRPETVYGAAKLFSENLGLCYRRLYGLDYRGLRLPNINGPGTTTHGYLEYTNKAIEESVAGRAYSVYVEPHVRMMMMHVADAARAFVELAEAPPEAIRTVNYTVLGPTPSPTAQELVDAVSARVPGAKLDFKVDPRVSALIDAIGRGPYVDRYARTEWGWQHRFDLGAIIDSFRRPEAAVAG